MPIIEEAKTYARAHFRLIVPKTWIDWLREKARKRQRSTSFRRIQHRDTPQTPAQLSTALRHLGLQPGCDVLVHSALSSLGPVERGAAGLLDAMRDVVGPSATILAPAYPFVGTMYDWMKDSEEFDVTRSRSRMGAFSEHLRSLPEARRSAHPTHSVVAIGPAAEEYTAQHHLDGTPTGMASPFYKLIQRKGAILCLGTGIGKITSYHVIEDVLPAFPINVYLPEAIAKPVVFADGHREPVRSRIANPKLTAWRVDNFRPKERAILALLREAKIVREGKVGKADCHLIDAGSLFSTMQEWLVRGITIYHRPTFGVGHLWKRP